MDFLNLPNLPLPEIYEFVASPFFVYATCFALFLYFVRWMLLLHLGKKQLHGQIAKATSTLREFNTDEDFDEAFAVASARMKQISMFKYPWRRFMSHVSDVDDAQYKVCTQNPEDFFPFGECIDDQLDRRAFKEVPWFLIAFGVAGTLFSVSGSLYMVRDSLNSIDLFLFHFLANTTLAMVPILAATILAIMFKRSLSSSFFALERAMQGFLCCVNEKVKPMGIHVFFEKRIFDKQLESMNEVSKNVREQTLTNRDLYNEISDQIAKEFKKAFSDGLHQELREIAQTCAVTTQTLKETTVTLAEANDVLEKQKTLDHMSRNLVDKLGGLIDSLEGSESLTSKWQQISEELTHTVQEVRTAQQGMADQWDKYCTRFEGVDESLAKSFMETRESIQDYTGRFKNLTLDLDKHLNRGMMTLSGAVNDLHRVVSKLPKENTVPEENVHS